MRVVTKEWLHHWSTSPKTGSWNAQQLAVLGINFNNRQSGWLNALIGKILTDEEAIRFEALSGRYDDPERVQSRTQAADVMSMLDGLDLT